MADQHQVKRLRKSITTWNTWRIEHLSIPIDLSSADFSKADLRGAFLDGANLSRANLSSADLSRASFSSANLSFANLFDASLSDANLSGADLSFAEISGAKLDRADLSFAYIGWTQLGDRDLRTMKGLETVRHNGPSPLSINTIYLSEGDIPESFVKGTGAPDSFIEYMHALARKPIQYYTCFLSYTNKDQDFAERLYADLQSKGIRCWYAQQELKAGDYYRHEIDESIRVSDKLLVILSQHSIHSDWVEREVNEALKKEEQMDMSTQVLFPLRLDETVMHTRKEWAKSVRFLRHILDFTNWQDHTTYQKALARLLRDLQQSERKPPPSS